MMDPIKFVVLYIFSVTKYIATNFCQSIIQRAGIIWRTPSMCLLLRDGVRGTGGCWYERGKRGKNAVAAFRGSACEHKGAVEPKKRRAARRRSERGLLSVRGAGARVQIAFLSGARSRSSGQGRPGHIPQPSWPFYFARSALRAARAAGIGILLDAIACWCRCWTLVLFLWWGWKRQLVLFVIHYCKINNNTQKYFKIKFIKN